MSLTVGILAYNSEQDLPGLLASLPDALAGVDDWHLVVVDGASTDGTVDLVRRTAPEATRVDLGGNRGLADPAGYSSDTPADWATGAVTMMSRACVTRAGPWDESFFLYSEETEFELRAADAGFRLAFADVDVVHLGGESRVRPELWSLLCA